MAWPCSCATGRRAGAAARSSSSTASASTSAATRTSRPSSSELGLERRRLRPARPWRQRGPRGRLACGRRPAGRSRAGDRRRRAPRIRARWCCSGTASAGLWPRASSPKASRRRRPAWHREVDALVLSSPALDTGMRPGQKRAAGDARAADAEPRRRQRPEARPASRATRRSSPRTSPIRWCTTASRRGWSASSSTPARSVRVAGAALAGADAAAVCRQRPPASRRPAAPPSRRRRRASGRDGAAVPGAVSRDLQRARAGRGLRRAARLARGAGPDATAPRASAALYTGPPVRPRKPA